MLSEIQSRKIRKYKKFAKKNIVFRYIAAILILCNILTGDIKRHHGDLLRIAGTFAMLVLVFFCNTSFAPYEAPSDYETIISYEQNEAEELQDFATETVEEESFAQDEVAGLEDLMLQNEKINPEDDVIEQGVTAFDKDDWKLLLVNKQHTIPEDYTFSLGVIKGSMKCDERIIEPLTEMFAAAKEDGINLVVCSPYRDMNRQEYLFDRKLKNYMNSGCSYMEAYKKASITVTVPGASEHQIGLAMDIICDHYSALDEGFGDTDAGIWLKENSADYGFILRYPRGKEDVTGIIYEPWHYRYVGKDAAKIIMSQNLTLEEFIENL